MSTFGRVYCRGDRNGCDCAKCGTKGEGEPEHCLKYPWKVKDITNAGHHHHCRSVPFRLALLPTFRSFSLNVVELVFQAMRSLPWPFVAAPSPSSSALLFSSSFQWQCVWDPFCALCPPPLSFLSSSVQRTLKIPFSAWGYVMPGSSQRSGDKKPKKINFHKFSRFWTVLY